MSFEKILIVDDELIIRRSLQRELEAKRYMAATAATLEEASRYLEKERFDLIFMDVRLPDGDGTELLKDLASDRDAPFVVMMTGYGSVESNGEEYGRRSLLDLGDFLRRQMQVFHALMRKGCRISLAVEKDALPVKADKVWLRHVLFLLFMDAGRGKVWVGRFDGDCGNNLEIPSPPIASEKAIAAIRLENPSGGRPSEDFAEKGNPACPPPRNSTGRDLGLFFAREFALAHNGWFGVQALPGRETDSLLLLLPMEPL